MKKRVNYDFERRKKELDRQRKKEEKLQRKQDSRRQEDGSAETSESPDGVEHPTAGS